MIDRNPETDGHTPPQPQLGAGYVSEVLPVQRRAERFEPRHTRVIVKPFNPGRRRIASIIRRVLTLSESEVSAQLQQVFAEFEHRHRDFRAALRRNVDNVREYLPQNRTISRDRELLIGAYFTHEFSISAAAMFNPSMVLHPDQSGVPDGAVRFIMSFRATGEGHISSIEFRSGVVDASNRISFEPESPYLRTPEVAVDSVYEKKLFALKLHELGALNDVSQQVLDRLGDEFTLAQLEHAAREVHSYLARDTPTDVLQTMIWLAESNYIVQFEPGHPISERVLFPVSEAESKGLEDARFVRFTEDDGSVRYYATYTAYNGIRILPQLIETADFLTFKILTLNGRAAVDKGLALFPRRIDGRYAMLARLDGESNYVMFSDNLHFWHEATLLNRPELPWEMIQVGNNGSPIETSEGWLVITHGVGPMRKYCLGCMLLDLNDPTKVIARLEYPLLCPNTDEREGYVPNVVYSCGALEHNGELIVPYAMSDSVSGIVTVHLRTLLDELLRTAEHHAKP